MTSSPLNMKSWLLALILGAGINAASAAPVYLGAAADYTLLSTGTPWTSQGGGSLILGVEAEIYGNVGARQYLGYGNGVTIHGNSDLGSSGFLSAAPDVQVDQQRPLDDDLWLSLYQDLTAASAYAAGLSGQSLSAIHNTTTLNSSGGLTVFHLDGDIALGSGQSLTFKGNRSDQFIVNISQGLNLQAGSAILFEGVQAENVLFNFVGPSFSHSVSIDGNGAPTRVGGIFLGANTHFSLGDGLVTPDGIQVLASGIIGNLQRVEGFDHREQPTARVTEPGALWLFAIGLVCLGIIRRRKPVTHKNASLFSLSSAK